MRCKDCKNHNQITKEEFNSLHYDKQRQLDCKNICEDGSQCDCYSKDHHPEEFETENIKMKQIEFGKDFHPEFTGWINENDNRVYISLISAKKEFIGMGYFSKLLLEFKNKYEEIIVTTPSKLMTEILSKKGFLYSMEYDKNLMDTFHTMKWIKTKQIRIMETDDAYCFDNHEEFQNVFKNPYVTLAKKVEVEDVGKVEFDVYDFINLIDVSWNTEGRSEKVLITNVGESLDYRNSFTTVLTWESRKVNCKGDGRKGLWTVLVMNFMKKDIWELIKNGR